MRRADSVFYKAQKSFWGWAVYKMIDNEGVGGLTKVDKKFIAFVNRYMLEIAVAVAVAVSLVIRFNSLSYVSGDFVQFLQPWFLEIKEHGGLLALGRSIGNYNISYMVLFSLLTYLPLEPIVSIKLLSIVFDYIGAAVAAMLVGKLLKNKPNARAWSYVTFILILFLPTVILNASAWAQCDFIYTTFLLLCLYYLIDRNYIPAFVFFGVAFCFKLQAVFLLPLLVLLYFREKRFSILHFLIIPGVFLVSTLPAVLMGRSFWEILSIYLGQTNYDKEINVDYPSVYYLMTENYDFFKIPGILFTMVVLALLLFVVLHYRLNIRGENLISTGMLIVLVCVVFLPCMHERYAFVADVLSVIYFVVKRKKVYIPLAINVISLLSYDTFIFGTSIVSFEILALANLALLVLVAKDVFYDLRAASIHQKMRFRGKLPMQR